jgi:hypothetical protein
MADESEVWTGTAFTKPSFGSSWGKILGVSCLILCFELPLTYAFFLFAGSYGFIGLVIIVATLYLAFRVRLFKRPPKLSYVLTNKRALIVLRSKDQQNVIQQCDLNGANAVVQNYHMKQWSSSGSRSGYQSSETREVGDVVFLRSGTKVLTFTNVADPNNVKTAADHIIDALRFPTS